MFVSRSPRRLAAVAAFLGLLAATGSWSSAAAGTVTPTVEVPGIGTTKSESLAPHVPGEVILAFQPGTGAAQRADLRRRVGARSSVPLSSMARDTEVVTLGSGFGVARAIDALRNAPGVRFVEPNYIVSTSEVSNDPDYTAGNLWGMQGATTSPANAFGSRAGEAWANGFVGSTNVVIGVIDEGIDVTHPDLAGNIWTNPGETAGDGIDNDANGFIDDVNGFDFVNSDGSVLDSTADSHGTHVSGTIGAKGGNGIGVVGVNWNVSLISAKFLQGGSGSTTNAVRAVDYITGVKQKYGLNIVATSNSWGGGGFSQALLDAIERGGDAGILFIAAAGNSSSNNDGVANYPSNYQCTKGGTRGFDCVLAVASITSTGGLSSFSSYGLTTVDIAAPGSSVKSTIPANQYAVYSGTSMATPHVSGAAALCEAANPAMTAAQLRAALVESARSTDSLAGRTLNAGRLDVTALLKRCVPSGATMTGAPSALTGTGVSQITARLDWTDGSTDETGYVIQRAPFAGSACGTFVTIGNLGADNNRYYASGLQPETTYCFRVGAVGVGGTQWTDSTSATTLAPPQQYTCSSVAYSWIEPPVDATTHTLTDDSSTEVLVPFAFDLYGTSVTRVQVSSNGFLRLGTGSAIEYAHAPIPSLSEPDSIAAAWWMDLNPARGGQIRSHVAGVSPNRVLVVSWLDILPYSTSATNGASFQILLDEASRSITFQYRDTVVGASTIDRGATGTGGVEGPDGTYGTQIFNNLARLTDLSAVRCTRSLGPVITTTSLPSGVSNDFYSQAIGVVGGSGTKTLSVVSGSLPTGLSIVGSAISGTPTVAGTWPFTLQVQDQNGLSSTSSLQIVVAAPIGVTSSSLTPATIGSAYSQSLAASGGIGPYTWSVTSGSLPAGLTLSSSGAISGTPSSTAKGGTFAATVTDSVGKAATASLDLRVNVSITTASVAVASPGTFYSQTLSSVGGASGVSHTWQVTSGVLPNGLSLATNTGIISGTPSNTSTSQTFTVTASDGVGGTASRAYTLSVTVPLVVTTTSLVNAPLGSVYSQTLTTSGASGSTTWALATGSLPSGLTLNTSTGVISGTTTSTAVSASFTVRATDGAGKVATKDLSISVVAATIPGAFNKTSPAKGATKVSRTPTISWGTSARANQYQYCFDRVNNATCDGSWVTVTTLNATLLGLLAKTTYYWQVRAVNTTTGEITIANTGSWWRFTTA